MAEIANGEVIGTIEDQISNVISLGLRIGKQPILARLRRHKKAVHTANNQKVVGYLFPTFSEWAHRRRSPSLGFSHEIPNP